MKKWFFQIASLAVLLFLTATLADFVIGPGDSADCQINLVFRGDSHSQTNADACYAAIGLLAKPVD